MTQSTLTADLTLVRRSLARFLGWDRDPTAWSGVQTTDAADCINAGARLFANPPPTGQGKKSHKWSFLRPITSFSSVASYSTGTVTIVDGVVTLAGGTFPTWAASGELILSTGTYLVSTRDSGTQLTLVDTSLDAAALTTYELARSAYDLPDDFGGFDGKLTYLPGQTNLCGPLTMTDESHIRTYRQAWDTTGVPRWFALRPKTFAGATGQLWQIILAPMADAVYTWQYRYRMLPDALTSTLIYHHGGQPHSQTFIAAVLAEADRMFEQGSKGMMADFLMKLQASIDHDVLNTTPDTLGYNGNAWEPVGDDEEAVCYGPHSVEIS